MAAPISPLPTVPSAGTVADAVAAAVAAHVRARTAVQEHAAQLYIVRQKAAQDAAAAAAQAATKEGA